MLKILKNLLKTTNHGLNSLQSIWLSKSILTILLGLNGQMQMLVLVKLQHLKATVSNWQTSLVYHRVTQYFFFQQWLKLKAYANDNHIEIVGDMPIYVAEDSSDMWANPHLFKTDVNGRRLASQDAHQMNFLQLVSFGGNPIYDWEAMDKDGYKWWIERLRESFKIYDIVRIDHFRGLNLTGKSLLVRIQQHLVSG